VPVFAENLDAAAAAHRPRLTSMSHRSTFLALVAVGVLGGAAVAHADAAKAKKLNAQGMQKYAKKHYDEALALFRAAIEADPGNVLAHYNAASVLSLSREPVEAGKELDALAASSDPAAAKALAKGKTDPDLERASTEAHVREVLGLPALATMAVDAILLERAGAWGVDGSACAQAALTITFKKNGVFTLRSEDGCDDQYDDTKHKGTWKVSGKDVTLTTDVFKGGATGTFGPCEREKTAWCLQVKDGDGNSYELARGAAVLM
jgi:tetratricopeptide (TPR) repeat protein